MAGERPNAEAGRKVASIQKRQPLVLDQKLALICEGIDLL